MSLPKRLWRLAYWLPRDLLFLARAGFPTRVLYCGGDGFGDYLLFGTVVEEARRRNLGRLAVVTRRPELFENWPPGARFFFGEYRLLEAARLCGARVSDPAYFLSQHPPVYDQPARSHLLAEMCRNAGLSGTVALRTYIHLTDSERTWGRKVPNQAVIQSTSPDVLSSSWLKHWYVERYQEVVDRFRGRLNFIQLGSTREPLLSGVADFRGKTSIRESAAILSASLVNIGYLGFLMHLARAVDVRSVVVFGGRERPDQSGYSCNENLFTPLSCSPCWRISTCDYDRLCMQRISAAAVAEAVERALAKDGLALELETAEIPRAPEEFPLPWRQPGFTPPK